MASEFTRELVHRWYELVGSPGYWASVVLVLAIVIGGDIMNLPYWVGTLGGFFTAEFTRVFWPGEGDTDGE